MLYLRLFFLCLLCFSCGQQGDHATNRIEQLNHWKEQNGKLKVLSTTAIINDLVKEIGNGHIDTLVLIQGDLDPHSYQLVKGDDEKLAFANLILSNGLGLEHGPTLHRRLHNENKGVALGDELQKKFPQFILHYNGQVDPHIWMDVSQWAETIPIIVSALSKQDPTHAEDYQENGKILMATLLKTHDEIKKELATVPEDKRYLVTSHDAFNYFTRAYLATEEEKQQNDWQKRFAAPEGLAPESQLSTSDIQLIIDHVAKHKIEILFPESNASKASIQKIISAGKEKGLQLTIADASLYADALGSPGSSGETYIKMMKHNSAALVKWLSLNPIQK